MVYLIADTERKYCKIGKSINPKERLGGIQTSSPLDLEIICTKEGSTNEEGYLHKKFQKYHIRGEWFQYNEEIVEYLNSIDIIPAKTIDKKAKSNGKRTEKYRQSRIEYALEYIKYVEKYTTNVITEEDIDNICKATNTAKEEVIEVINQYKQSIKLSKPKARLEYNENTQEWKIVMLELECKDC